MPRWIYNPGVSRPGAALLLLMVGTPVAAEPFLSSDPRNLGMGGAGVAVESGMNAVHYNPALISPGIDPHRLSFNFPTVGLGIQDREEFIEAYDDFDDSGILDRTRSDFSTFNEQFEEMVRRSEDGEYATNEQVQEDLAELQGRFDTLDGTRGDLFQLIGDMDEKPITFDFRGAAAAGGRAGQWGMAYHYQARGYGGGQFRLDTSDFDMVNTEFDAGQDIIDCFDEASSEGTTPDEDRMEECEEKANLNQDVSDDFTSEFESTGALVRELGVSFARDFHIGDRALSFGLTPKLVEVDTFDYRVRVQDEAEASFTDTEKTDNAFTVDAGASMEIVEGVRGGLSVRHLIPHSHDTVEGETIRFDPMARAGVAWDPARNLTLAADLDLTENRAVGFGPRTRFLSLGSEVRVGRIAQFRLGYRLNLSADDDIIGDRASVGFGFTPGAFRIDVGAAGNSNEASFFFQTGLQFRARN